MTKGWNKQRSAFVQHYDEKVLDSSLLRMSSVGFIFPLEPMWLSTLPAMDSELVTDSLVCRYDPGASPDGLAGSEGTFSLCTFMYVDALARAGRLEDARLVFEKMLTYANHVGLCRRDRSERRASRDLPQAFTHLALIDSAITLNAQLDRPQVPASCRRADEGTFHLAVIPEAGPVKAFRRLESLAWRPSLLADVVIAKLMLWVVVTGVDSLGPADSKVWASLASRFGGSNSTSAENLFGRT